jgi:type I restriction enzyme S subunit
MTSGEHDSPFLQQLPTDWSLRKVQELLAEPVRNGIYKKKEFYGRGQKIVNMGELFAHDFISNQEMKRVELNSYELEKYLVKDGDLLFARRSLVLEGSGKCSLVVRPSESTTFESSIIRARLNQNEALPRFYYYFFHSPPGHALMASIATRTAVSGIRGSDLVLLEVPHPPLPTQRKIAAILSAYDDLIENNARRIAILEDMAQAIYREWFVHFRFPEHAGVRMVESELGHVPEGWEIKSFSEIADFINGFAFKPHH